MIDIYLLCLAKEGKLRILLKGKAGTAEHIDYTNIADQTFTAALLNSMAKVQRLKAPEGWPVLAPYAAVLMGDEALKTIQKDTEIQKAVADLLKWRQQRKPEVDALAERLDGLVADIGQPNPVADCLTAWKAFLSAKIDEAEAIPHLLNALDAAFGYTCYAENESKQTELDDLATRKRTWEKAEVFCRHDQKVRAAYRYSQLQLAKDSVLKDLRDKVKNLDRRLASLADLLDSEAKLQSQLLDPLADIQEVYRTRYLQAFDLVSGKCEGVRDEIDALPDSAVYKAVADLTKIDALGTIDLKALKDDLAGCKAGLFESSVDRNGVERALKDRPQPEGCPLHVDQAAGLVAAAEQAAEQAKRKVHSALVTVATLLRQPALQVLLKQGEQEPFVAETLKAPDAEKLADLLADRIPADQAAAKTLAKYLKRIVVKTVHIRDFRPSKATLEKTDIDTVVGEFRKFLEAALDGDGRNQSTILDIK